MPDARRVVLTFLIGLAVMVAALTGAGLLITETEVFEGVRDWDSSISTDMADRSEHGRHRPGSTHHQDG